MTTPRTLAASLVLALTLAPPLVAQDELRSAALEALDRRRAALVEDLLPELLELAGECRRERLYKEMDDLYRVVLHLDPEERTARRGLKYRRVGSKGWIQSGGYRPGRNQGKADAAQWQARCDALLVPYREVLLAAIDDLPPELGPLPAWRELEALARSLPEDGHLRERLGEVEVDGRWVLVETQRARLRRKAIPDLAAACLQLAPDPTPGEIRGEERRLPLEWIASRATPRVRVLGTTAEAEVSHTARISHAVGDLFRYALDADGRHREDFTIYLLTQGEKNLLLEGFGGLSPEDRAGLGPAAGGWLGRGNRLGEWDANPARRLDGAARQTLGTFMMDVFGIDGRHGWAWEGIGLYLTHELIGTRLTWFFHPEGYAPAAPSGLWTRLQSEGVDWLEEAASLIDRGATSPLVYLLGRGVNGMNEVDALHAYALGAFLLEGHARRVPRLLERIGGGEHPTLVFEDELGFPLPVIEARLRRFLLERPR